jgi:hypothetical protein
MAKPNLAFVALMLGVAWLINHRFRKFVVVCSGIGCAAVGAFIVSGVAFESVQCWKDWLTVLPSIANYRYVVDTANFSPSMLIFQWTGIKSSTWLAIGFITIATAFIWIGRPRVAETGLNAEGVSDDSGRELFEDIFMVATGCLIYLLSATLVWLHYYILTIPMALIVLRPIVGEGSGSIFGAVTRRIVGAAAIVIIAELPIRVLFSVTDPYRSALLLNIGTLILFGLGLWELVRLGRGPFAVKTQLGMGERNENI